MKFQLATKDDKAQVLQLFDEFSVFLKAEGTPSEVGGEMFDEVVSRDDTKIFVIKDESKILGLATFYLLPNIRHGWKRGHIEDFFVTPSKHRMGVGTFLLNSIKDYCRENNIKVIKLDSGNELTAAHSFYEKNGGRSTDRFFRFDID